MNISYKNEDKNLKIVLNGELDHHGAHEVKNALDKLISEVSPAGVIFDFKGVSFMDSTGIGVLLGRYKLLKSMNAEVYLTNPSPTIDRLLKLSGIYNVIVKI